MAAVGLGGIYTEIFGDVTVALAPVDDARGRADAALAPRGAAAGRCPRAAAARRSRGGRRPRSRSRASPPRTRSIAEIEINPLLVTPDGALGLDARVIANGERCSLTEHSTGRSRW